ncbi:MAG: hypothetical protein R3F11_20335 [Verrucomicrobiales bacterium]
MTIASNAAGAKATYTFAVSGVGEGPDLAVKGGVNFAENIANGDVTPNAADGTDFGNVSVTGTSVTRTFLIENTGNDTLTVTTGGSSHPAFTVAGCPGHHDANRARRHRRIHRHLRPVRSRGSGGGDHAAEQ